MEHVSESSLEHFFGKELPLEQNFLFIEDIDAKGELILLDLIKNYLYLNFDTVLVLLDALPHRVFEELAAKESNNFSIVTTQSNLSSKYKTSSKLHEINLTLKAIRRQIQPEKKLAMFFWSLNPLFILYDSNNVIQFYMENVKHSIENKTIEFYLIQKGLVDDLVIRRLIAIAHCVIQLEKTSPVDDVYNVKYLKSIEINCNRKKIKYKFEVGNSIWNNKILFIDHL